MKVLFLTHIFSDVHVGGETQGAWGLANALAESGVKIFVVSAYTEIKESKLHSNIKVYTVSGCQKVPNFTKPYMLKTFFYSLPLIFLKGIDIIHLAPTNGSHPFSRFKIKPFVSTADLPYDYEDKEFLADINYDREKKWEEIALAEAKYGLLEKIFNKFSYYFYKFFIPDEKFPRGVDLYAVRETKIEKDLKAEGYKSDFVFIPMAVDADKFKIDYHPDIKKDPNIITFLFLGMISKRKGTHYLIKAFNLLSKKYDNIKLIIAGEGAPSTVEDFKKLAGDNTKIEFAGKAAGDRRLDYYAACDVFISDALGQFGLYKVHVEAMAMKKPVILAKYYDTVDFEKNKLGIAVEHGNINQLMMAMEKFIINPALIKEFGQNAREFVVKNNDFKILGERMKEAYSKLLTKKK